MARQIIPDAGVWSDIASLQNQNNQELYETIHFGIYDYNDASTSTTPLSVPSNSTFVDIPNDGAGAFTNRAYALPNVDDLWDTTTNRFNWTPLSLGDTVDIRLDLEVTTTSPNQLVEIDLELATGAGTYDILFFKGTFKNTGANDVNRFNSIYMGDLNTLNNPARFKIRSDSTATVVVRGWYLRAFNRISQY